MSTARSAPSSGTRSPRGTPARGCPKTIDLTVAGSPPVSVGGEQATTHPRTSRGMTGQPAAIRRQHQGYRVPGGRSNVLRGFGTPGQGGAMANPSIDSPAEHASAGEWVVDSPANGTGVSPRPCGDRLRAADPAPSPS